LLETHACQGGATAGYIRAGWDPTVVDIAHNHAKYNPAPLVIADAATYIREHGSEYDGRHSSPPCQWYTRGNAPRRGRETKWERSIPPIREALEECGGPYVIENVKDAIWDLRDPVLLCGCMFDLSTIDTDGIQIHLQRPRLFEVNWDIPALVEQELTVGGKAYVVRSPRACDHSEHEWVAGAYGGARRDKYEAKFVRKGGYVPPSKDVVKALLGVEHDMTWNGLFECLPPAYTEWLGRKMLAAVEAKAAA
jgi:DNA (cytosine-5)-methyltransferase 1